MHADRFDLARLRHPIVQAPMAGGPSTAALSAAVSEAGGLGILAAGYRTAEQVRDEIAAVRAATAQPFGLNLFVPGPDPGDGEALARYAAELRAEGERYGASVGEARYDDDGWEAKLALALAERVPVVSFTFGCPPAPAIAQLHEAGATVLVTVTEVDEARAAAAAGADALVVQGVEAGGHRGSFSDEDGRGELGLLALLRLVARAVDLPLVASGGIADGPGIAATLAAGAVAAQLGTAFLRAPEAGTLPAHRVALQEESRRTTLTRAFSGKRARGLENRFLREHAGAPARYPRVHHMTAPLRAAARARGDGEGVNLWAGQAHVLTEAAPAGELVRRLGEDAREALQEACRRLAD